MPSFNLRCEILRLAEHSLAVTSIGLVVRLGAHCVVPLNLSTARVSLGVQSSSVAVIELFLEPSDVLPHHLRT